MQTLVELGFCGVAPTGVSSPGVEVTCLESLYEVLASCYWARQEGQRDMHGGRAAFGMCRSEKRARMTGKSQRTETLGRELLVHAWRPLAEACASWRACVLEGECAMYVLGRGSAPEFGRQGDAERAVTESVTEPTSAQVRTRR